MTHRSLLVLPLLGALVSCGGGVRGSYELLEPDMELLRSAFVSDSGKVRAIFLASPT